MMHPVTVIINEETETTATAVVNVSYSNRNDALLNAQIFRLGTRVCDKPEDIRLNKTRKKRFVLRQLLTLSRVF